MYSKVAITLILSPFVCDGNNFVCLSVCLFVVCLIRFSSGNEPSVRRYRNEVRMHREMGMNLIRVWGGGIAERTAFYDACDEMGVLVMQEVRMAS